jgi:hypothetical protein
MLSEEWLRVIQEERKREIEAARRAHEARSSAPRQRRVRAWLGELFAQRHETPPAPVRTCPQTGAATDFSA